jgi:hypothetical protein
MLTPKNTYFSMHILFQELKQLLLFFVYNLKGKINEIKNISKPTQKSLCFKQMYEFVYCLRMIDLLISLLIYLIPFCFQHFKNIITLNICVMQNYIMLTPKNSYFPMHILFEELKQFLLFFVYNLKGKIN